MTKQLGVTVAFVFSGRMTTTS
uniref:Uncharacterized protein n=1 Tax=Rhizophora mucronata TaxID=61149 RepID=A0A2P2IHI9_RHIMU